MEYQEPEWLTKYRKETAEDDKRRSQPPPMPADQPPPIFGQLPGEGHWSFARHVGQGWGSLKHNPRKFETQEELIELFMEYVEYMDTQSFYEDKAFTIGGKIEHTKLKRGGPLTLTSWLLYINLDMSNWYSNYRDNEDFAHAVKLIDMFIKDHKFRGAAAGVYNANIISRDLGLADRVDNINHNLNHNTPQVEVEMITVDAANLVHPDDPNPEAPRMLFTQSQIDAGLPFPFKEEN